MRRTDLLQGLRMMRFEAILNRWHRDELSRREAAEMLGTSERAFRWTARYEEAGLDGRTTVAWGAFAAHAGRRGREVLRLYRERYRGSRSSTSTKSWSGSTISR